MSEYRRFIAYFYEYIDGKKQGNVGFVKVELRNGLWRFFLRLTVGTCPVPPIQVYGFVREQDHLLGLPLGTVRPVQQIAEEWAFRDNAPIGEGKHGLKELAGIWISSSDGRRFITAWDGEEVDAGRLLTEAEALEAEATEKKAEEAETGEDTVITEEREKEKAEEDRMQEECDLGNEEPEDPEKSEEPKEPEEPEEPKEPKEPKEPGSALPEPKEMPTLEAAEVEIEEAAEEETPVSDEDEDTAAEIGEDFDIVEQLSEKKEEVEEVETEKNETRDEVWPEERGADGNKAEENAVGENTAEENAAPRMSERGREVMEELLQKRAVFQPFADARGESCVMILPCDIARLQQENWQVGRSSFLQHGFYLYRHLLLGRAGDGTYILGVPGIDNPQEEYMAQMFGYGQFRRSARRDGGQTFGYWCRELRQI